MFMLSSVLLWVTAVVFVALVVQTLRYYFQDRRDREVFAEAFNKLSRQVDDSAGDFDDDADDWDDERLFPLRMEAANDDDVDEDWSTLINHGRMSEPVRDQKDG